MAESQLTLDSLLRQAYRTNLLGQQRGLRVEDVQRYLDGGGSPNDRTDHNMTLLHHAADNGDIDVIELLVQRGADVNPRDAHGYIPLHRAVDLDCNTASRDGVRATALPLTAALLRLGADPNLPDNEGETPRDVAKAYGERELALFDGLVAISSDLP